MPRPRLCRKVCVAPGVTYFKPAGIRMVDLEETVLAVDEFEAVRLKDLEGLEQGAAARRMGISQPTFHRMISSARKKIADAIVNGKAIKIEGGVFEMTGMKRFRCRKGRGPAAAAGYGERKGENMRICVPTTTAEGGKARAYEHFGSAPHFTIFDTATGSYEVIGNASQHHAHGACHPMGMLEGRKIDAVVCAGMGARALQRLNEGGIRVYRTIPGTVEEVVEKFGTGQLEEMSIDNACGQHKCR